MVFSRWAILRTLVEESIEFEELIVYILILVLDVIDISM